MTKQDKWDDIYTDHNKNSDFMQFSEHQIDTILSQSCNTRNALDIGCGEGDLMYQLEQRGIEGTGIDISKLAISRAQDKVPQGSFICANFEDYQFPNDISFDLIFAKFVIAFIENKESFLDKINQLLKEDGTFVIMTPVAKELPENNEIFISQITVDNLFPHFSERIITIKDSQKLSLFIYNK